MNVIYEKTAHFDEEMKSGLMKEKFGEIYLEGQNLNVLASVLNEHFRTNLNTEGQKLSDLDLLIWANVNEENGNSLELMVNDSYPSAQRANIVKRILDILNDYQDNVQVVRITRDSEIDPALVEQLLTTIQDGDVAENVIASIPKLCFIDSETYRRNERIATMIDEFEDVLFQELVNRKIRVNGQAGVLREVKGTWNRYGFFETGVKKNYVNLSLMQKMGTRTIRSLEF